MTTLHTAIGKVTVTTDDTYYTITCPFIPVGDSGRHIDVYATWSPGDDTLDTRIDVNALELDVEGFKWAIGAMEAARVMVMFLETELNWRGMIEAHLEAENAAA